MGIEQPQWGSRSTRLYDRNPVRVQRTIPRFNTKREDDAPKGNIRLFMVSDWLTSPRTRRKTRKITGKQNPAEPRAMPREPTGTQA